MKLSHNFTLEEMIFSQVAARKQINNMPAPAIIENLRKLCKVLEAVRAELNDVPIIISSGYRCPALNKAIGGSKNSAHMEGFAADFTAPAFGNPYAVAQAISRARSWIVYDQLIYEFGSWVHLGLREGLPRHQNLSIFQKGKYLEGIRQK